MPLKKEYSLDFERVYRAYPDYPKGRTKKHLAAKAFEKARKEFGFSDKDIDDLILLIDRMKKDRKSWQRGNAYGPQGLQVWLNQAGWQDDYEKTSRAHKTFTEQPVETPEQIAAKIAQQKEQFEKGRQQAELRREMQRAGIH